MTKILVAYFSASGCTAKLARRIAEVAQADLFEIEAAKPYSAADLNWTNKQSRTSVEMADPSSRPAIASRLQGLDQYDTVFLGFPIWWYVAPTIVNTFLESYDFSGKKIVLFATSGGSGMGKTASVLAPCAPGATIEPGEVLNFASAGKLQKFVERYL